MPILCSGSYEGLQHPKSALFSPKSWKTSPAPSLHPMHPLSHASTQSQVGLLDLRGPGHLWINTTHWAWMKTMESTTLNEITCKHYSQKATHPSKMNIHFLKGREAWTIKAINRFLVPVCTEICLKQLRWREWKWQKQKPNSRHQGFRRQVPISWGPPWLLSRCLEVPLNLEPGVGGVPSTGQQGLSLTDSISAPPQSPHPKATCRTDTLASTGLTSDSRRAGMGLLLVFFLSVALKSFCLLRSNGVWGGVGVGGEGEDTRKIKPPAPV